MAVTQKKPDHFEQLLLLRAFTKTTGMLHDAQVLQLKMWPRVLFQRSTASQIRVDVAKAHLSFDIAVAGGKPIKGVLEPDAPKLLHDWVKSLLGPEWSVSIYLSEGKRKKDKHHFPGEEKKDDKPEA